MATQRISLDWFGKNVKKRLASEAEQRVLAASEHLRGALIEKLSGNRSGRLYRIPYTSTSYRASVAGEAPASRTGRLRQSINTEVSKSGKTINADTGTELDYGEFLERGTIHIRPRPWLKPTYDEEKGKIKSILEDSWTL